MNKLAVVAIGGNSLIKDKSRRRVEDQYEAIKETAVSLVDIVELGYQILVTHGNGAQVGFILRRSEIAFKHEGLHFVPLVSCVADTQGAIGYQIQQALNNEFKKRGISQSAVTVVTQVRVDRNDPAFEHPAKPIGAFYEENEVEELLRSNPGWNLVEDSGRGYRRVVASPKPVDIVEKEVIRDLVKRRYCVIAAGGGGIPVFENERGMLEGVDAVIDKDFASMMLALEMGAETLIVSTGVDKICLNFGKPNQIELSEMTLAETKSYIEAGHFARGSMLPKIAAIVSFLEQGGKKAIVSRPEFLKEAVLGRAGTCIYGE